MKQLKETGPWARSCKRCDHAMGEYAWDKIADKSLSCPNCNIEPLSAFELNKLEDSHKEDTHGT